MYFLYSKINSIVIVLAFSLVSLIQVSVHHDLITDHKQAALLMYRGDNHNIIRVCSHCGDNSTITATTMSSSSGIRVGSTIGSTLDISSATTTATQQDDVSRSDEISSISTVTLLPQHSKDSITPSSSVSTRVAKNGVAIKTTIPQSNNLLLEKNTSSSHFRTATSVSSTSVRSSSSSSSATSLASWKSSMLRNNNAGPLRSSSTAMMPMMPHQAMAPNVRSSSEVVDEWCGPGGQLDELSYAVLQKIRSGILQSQKLLASIPSNVTKPRILCMVYTHQGAHDHNLRAIVDTWANDCDGFFAASNFTDDSLHAIELQYQGEESYSNMWQKVKAMWNYTYHHYMNDYDYFHICGDDVYVVVDNLRTFLMSDQVHRLLNGYLDIFSIMSRNKRKWLKDKSRALVLGYPLHLDMGKKVQQYAAGGSGYTFNREAVRVFHNLITKYPDNLTDAREDILVGKWLELHGITCSDTRDDRGAFRYVPNNPIIEYPCLHRWVGRNLDDQVKCHRGLDAFSNETVAVHLNYRKIRGLRHIINYTEEILYRYDYLLTGGIRRGDVHHGRAALGRGGGGCDEKLLSFQPNETRMELIQDSQRKTFTRRKAKLLRRIMKESVSYS